MSKLARYIPSKYHYRLSAYKRFFLGYTVFSQFGEDRELAKLFKDRGAGFYVDVGAHHPKRYSNTYLLFKRGWSGINIDPDPAAIALFKKARPKDCNVETGVAKEPTTLSYYQFSDPAINSFKESEAARWMDKDWVTFLGIRQVAVMPLREILTKYAPGKHIDVLSVDAEGMGLEVLESNDWERFTPSVIVVEDDVKDFLAGKGYHFHTQCGLSDIFVHKDFRASN